MNTKTLKYIRYDEDRFMIFPVSQTHAEMASGLIDIISAGFMRVADGQVHCHGRSVSLDIDSRPEEDARMLQIRLIEVW